MRAPLKWVIEWDAQQIYEVLRRDNKLWVVV